jgi:hypothetical protein
MSEEDLLVKESSSWQEDSFSSYVTVQSKC